MGKIEIIFGDESYINAEEISKDDMKNAIIHLLRIYIDNSGYNILDFETIVDECSEIVETALKMFGKEQIREIVGKVINEK